VVLYWESDYASQYQIQVSLDSSSWTTLYSDYSGTGGTKNITFNPTNARYVKIYCINRTTSYGFSIWEFQVFSNNSIENCNLYDVSGKCKLCSDDSILLNNGTLFASKIKDCTVYDDENGACKQYLLESEFAPDCKEKIDKIALIVILTIGSLAMMFLMIFIAKAIKQIINKPKSPFLDQFYQERAQNKAIYFDFTQQKEEFEKAKNVTTNEEEKIESTVGTLTLRRLSLRIQDFMENERKKKQFYVFEILENEPLENIYQIKLEKVIGKGGYGTVWKVFDKAKSFFRL